MDVRRNDGSEVQVNDRVSLDGHFGTVKFTGSLPDTKGKRGLVQSLQVKLKNLGVDSDIYYIYMYTVTFDTSHRGS
jgi:dynactin complex subunit